MMPSCGAATARPKWYFNLISFITLSISATQPATKGLVKARVAQHEQISKGFHDTILGNHILGVKLTEFSDH